MVKIRDFDLDYVDEAPQSERRRDIRIRNHKMREESENSRRMKQGRIRHGQK